MDSSINSGEGNGIKNLESNERLHVKVAVFFVSSVWCATRCNIETITVPSRGTVETCSFLLSIICLSSFP